VIGKLTDDTLVVFLSDSHIGGDQGRDIFESPDDLAALFESLAGHPGPVELVLAGDFFDLLRIADPPAGKNRASATLSRPEYADLFAALRRFASEPNRTVVYLPGNHDAEAWWNHEIRADLEEAGLVHEFALSYSASFESDPDRVVSCEHGNQFDPTNTIRDYDDPLDTPLGEHVVTDVLPHLPTGWETEGGNLRAIDRVFPLSIIPGWLAGRLFYQVATQTVRWLLLPLLILLVAHAILENSGSVGALLLELAYDIGILLLVFGVFLFVAARATNRVIRASTARVRGDAEHELIRSRLQAGEPPPLSESLTAEIAVFISGHTHAPSLTHFDGPRGDQGAQVNSGCWLRQLQPVPGRFGAPPVFVSRFVQTHVRVYRDDGAIQVELWEHPRPSPKQLRVLERLAVIGRLPAEPDHRPPPSVRQRVSIKRSTGPG
jgi:UDP-2,3-diacylglucosamine pyrophosphatase LpxH